MSSHNVKAELTKCVDDILLIDKITYTYERTWKDIIFIPFLAITNLLFDLLLITTIHIHLFMLCFDPILEEGTFIFKLIIVSDFAYAIHTGMLIAHKMMKTHRKRRFYHPNSWQLIWLDIVSVLPLGPFRYFMENFQWVSVYSENFSFYTNCLKLVRIVRIICKYMEYNSSPGVDSKILITVFHFLLSSIVTHIIMICYYSLCCLDCRNDNFAKYFSYITFDDQDDMSWLVVLYTYVHLVMLHNYWGILTNEAFLEHFLAIMSLATGLILRYIFMMGNMITYYIRGLRYMFWYKQEHVWTNHLMKLLQFDENLIEKVNEYYKTIWKEYKGINVPPQIFKMFPLALQREVLVDIYWDALMHTHMFSSYNQSVRREAASLMTTEIRMPGEVIFSTGSLKSKLIYIVNGVVELMATENAGAPIMSFKSGTILGAISFAMPTISNGTFVCSTTCHIHVLKYHDMHKLYRNTVGIHKDIMSTIKDRIKFAKVKRLFLVNSGISVNASHIGWIKQQWRAIAFYDINEKNAEVNHDDIHNECYSSRFLDLLVLSSGHDWHRDIICLRDKCPLIIKEETGFRRSLHYLNLLVIALQFLTTAKCIAFDQKISSSLMPVLLILDLFYFLDLYVQLITMPKGFQSTKPMDIMLYRCRQMFFILDVIATVPYDYFSSAFGLSDIDSACLRAPRFLKLYKLVEHFQQLEFVVPINNLYFTKFAKFMVLHGVFIMIFVCISYIINCYNNCDSSWLAWSRKLNTVVTGIDYEKDDYAETFHHLISVYLGLKISNKMEINLRELILSAFIATVGFYVSTFCFVQLTAVVSLLQEFTHHFLLDMDILNEITDRKDLLHLKSKIINFANVQWNLNKNQTLKDIYTVMGQESVYLRRIVTKDYVMKAFGNTTLFRDANPRYLRQLAYNSTLLVIPEGHMIYDASYKIYYLYLIVEGNCKYRSLLPCDLDKGVEKVMEKNNCFPVVSLFEELPPLVRVTSLTTVILLCIPYLKIKQLLRAFPIEGAIMRKTCELHKEENEAILKRTPPQSLFRYAKTEAERVPIFTYTTEHSCKTKSFYYGLTKMDKFFRMLVFTTYDPNSKGYIWYEVFRSTCIIIQVIVVLLTAMSGLYRCFIGPCGTVLGLFWFLGLIDIYVRGHVQYYNEFGIKVTKLSKTFKHYVDTSFPTDFIATFPYQLLGIVGIFYGNTMRAYLIMMVIMRSLALYRPAKLFVYLKNSVNPKYQIYFIVTAAVLIGMYFFATTTHIYLILTCDTTRDSFEVYKNSWINMYTSLEYIKENYLYLIIYYVVSSMTITYTYSAFSFDENLLQLLIVLYIFIMKMFFVTYVLGCESHGNIRTAKHQDAIRDYLGFTSKKLVSNKTKQEMIEHVGNYWKKSNGASPKQIFENFSPYMKEEIFLSLYKQALLYSYFFHDSEESLYRLMVSNVDELYFKKDADIIRTNDVQDYVYIVASGHVTVTMADLYICTLRVGGIFGCFHPKGQMRQTARITAAVHVKILIMKTSYLYEIASIYNVVHTRLNNIFVTRQEYIREVSYIRDGMGDEHSYGSVSKTQTTKTHGRTTSWFYRTVYEGNILIKIWNYVTNVHIVSISSTYCLYVLAVDDDINLLWLWILLDLFFLLQMYIRSHTAYTDLDTGVSVYIFEAVAVKYVKSIRFYVDLVSIIPLYAFSYLFDVTRRSAFLGNKFIRVCNLYTYYYSYVVRKNVPRHLQWTFLIYNTLFLLQVVFDIWYTVSDYDEDIKVIKCYLRVFSVYTSTGLVEREFNSEVQLMVNLILIYVAQSLLIYMLVVITRLLIDYNYTVSIFKINVHLLMVHCKNELLSKPLAEKIFTYLIYLYRYHNGRQDPILFQGAPPYILQDHKAALYARFIEKHNPFSHAHVDFMRQLFAFVEVGIYLPGDMIVEVGDCNSTMYIIEEGEVIGIEEVKGELTCEVIKEGLFGKKQGLINVEHTKTYRALTVCSILSVCKHKWAHLLEFFPATREVMDEAIVMELAETDTVSENGITTRTS